MFTWLKTIFAPQIETLNILEINAGKLIKNLEYLDSLQPENNALFPVLKSNAYGHGLKEVAKILKDTPVPYICVDSFPEYQIVKDYAKKKSLIIGETIPENYVHYSPQRATLVVYNEKTIDWLIQQKRPFTIHLFLNTGMNREGIQKEQLEPIVRRLKEASHLTLEGVMSHLAMADEPDDPMTVGQIEVFKSMYTIIEQYDFSPKRKYIGNSAGMTKIFDLFFNAWRVGIAFYGYNHLDPEDKVWDILDALEPALRITTKVVSIQKIKQGDIVSYGCKFVANKDMTVATVPFGYHEGLNRKLTNNRKVIWTDDSNKRHILPLIGTICMNLSSFDTFGRSVKVGDTIEIISRNKDDQNTIQKFANITETIPYEVLVNIDSKIRRKVI